MAADYYQILGVPRDATTQDIKRAFRRIARECHPDVAGGDTEAEERFKSSRKAYETLMDPVARARYDRRGQRRTEGSGSFFDAFYKATADAQPKGRSSEKTYANHVTGGEAPKSRRRSGARDPGNDVGLDDLFNDFGDFGFGRSGAKKGNPGPPPPQRRPEAGRDVQTDLEVPADTALEGGSVTAVYYRMQRADSWRPGAVDPGLIRVQDIADVRIIPGTRDGEVLRERGLGDAGAWGGPYGDLVARVRLVGREKPTPPPEPTPAAPPAAAPADHVDLDISVPEAILGGRVQLLTPQGDVRLTVPPGTSSGTRLRLKGKGSLGPDGEIADLYVVLRIVVPRELDNESRELIEAFARLNPDDPRS